MPKPAKLTPETLKVHIEAHRTRRDLKIGWDAFCAMADAKASTNSMANTFKVEWRIMSRWLELYTQLDV